MLDRKYNCPPGQNCYQLRFPFLLFIPMRKKSLKLSCCCLHLNLWPVATCPLFQTKPLRGQAGDKMLRFKIKASKLKISKSNIVLLSGIIFEWVRCALRPLQSPWFRRPCLEVWSYVHVWKHCRLDHDNKISLQLSWELNGLQYKKTQTKHNDIKEASSTIWHLRCFCICLSFLFLQMLPLFCQIGEDTFSIYLHFVYFCFLKLPCVELSGLP